MQEVILKILNMSIAGSVAITAVMLLRLVLRRAPKNIRCVMWATAGIRLVCPFTLPSVFSLIPEALYISNESIYSGLPSVSSTAGAHPAIDIDPALIQTVTGDPIDPLYTGTLTAFVIWLAGVLVIAVWGIIGYVRLKKRVGASVCLGGRTFACDDIDSPFILGLAHPRIYVPSTLTGDQLECVEAHENAHLARLDHGWKPLGFAVLCVHWFNPLVWAAYALFCRDIELACDERVIRDMTLEEKKFYSATLLECSTSRSSAAACPLAFGEAGVKDRVKNVLRFKKPTAFVIAAAIVVCLAAGAFFLTDQPGTAIDDELDAFISQSILEHCNGDYKSGSFACEAHTVLAATRSRGETTVYAAVMYHEYSLREGVIVSESGSHIPTAITVRRTDDGYELVEYWESDDGTRYAPSIREKFPWYAEDRAIGLHTLAPAHEAECIRQAEEFFGIEYVDPYEGMTWATTAVTAE